MSHTHTRFLVHVVFATKDRLGLLTPDVKSKSEKTMVGIIKNLDVYLLALNSEPDHVHMLVDIPAKLPISEFVSKVKSNSSRLINKEFPKLGFAWQRGYGGFSVSQSHISNVVQYINNQQEHHQGVSLKDEFARLLERNGLDFDPEFVG